MKTKWMVLVWCLLWGAAARAQKAELVVQLGHTGFIKSVAYSPDGKTLASGGWDNTITVWDVATGKLLRTLTGHTSSVESVSYSPDGKTLASGSLDKTIKVWDVATGKLLRTLTGHTSFVKSVSYSPDGKTLASGSLDESIKVWDVATGKLLRTLVGHTSIVESVSYSPDGKTLASGSNDTSVRFWNARSAQASTLTTYSFSDGNSVVLDEQGRFDGTPGGLQQLHYVVGLQPVKLGQFKERYFQPGLWGKVMGTDPGLAPDK